MANEELSEVLGLVKENNKILRKMQRASRFSSFMRYIYWILIIGSTASAYYYLQPYINQLLQIYDQLDSTVRSVNNKVNSLPDGSNLKNLNLPPELLKTLDSVLKNQ